LQYCTASAAALGLSQLDLLKLEKALATPTTACNSPSPSVIYLAGQNCSGCQTSLLNRVVMVTGGYYDGDFLACIYGGMPNVGTANDKRCGIPIPELNYVNDVADLLVGDALGALTCGERTAPRPEGHPWAPFYEGYITLEWLTTVMASAGDIPVRHLDSIVAAGGFVLLIDGAIPTGTSNKISWPANPTMHTIDNERYCFQLDAPPGLTSPNAPPAGPVTIADCVRWMAPQCAVIITVGTCSSFGGIPAANRNRTGAVPADVFLAQNGISKPLIKCPGCPPHPDWIVYPVVWVYYYLNGLRQRPTPPLDAYGRPAAVYGNVPLCVNCANYETKGKEDEAQNLGDSGCLQQLGCKGQDTQGDCPLRQKNTMDDGTLANWCVGAQGTGSLSGCTNDGIGSAQHPCQGCIMPGFPDGMSPFYEPLDGS
jgi:hydrogenase small subunit